MDKFCSHKFIMHRIHKLIAQPIKCIMLSDFCNWHSTEIHYGLILVNRLSSSQIHYALILVNRVRSSQSHYALILVT